MSANSAETESSDWLRLLVGSRLQTQVSRSGALDAGALGVMAVDVAVTLIVVGTGGSHLSILALLMLGLSFGLAMKMLRLPSAKETGPSLAAIRKARKTDEARAFEDSLLDDLEEDLQINDRALTRKTLLLEHALTFLVLAIPIELVGRVVR